MTTKRYASLVMLVVTLMLGLVGQAFAKKGGGGSGGSGNLQIGCVTPTLCSAGSTTQVTTGMGLPTFNVGSSNGFSGTGSLVLVILVPNQGSVFTINGQSPTLAGIWSPPSQGSAKLFSTSHASGFLSQVTIVGGSNPDISAFQSATAQVGVTANSFHVYTFSLGSFTGGGSTSVTTGGSIPAGTIFYAYLTNSQGQAIINTPLSESLTSKGGGAVPEPSSLALLGSGIVVFGGFLRRRLGIGV
jgi:hypothetical protein